MTERALPDFTAWSPDRLSAQRDHLVQILMTMAGQEDPLKPRLRAELAAVRAELAAVRAELAAVRAELARRPDDTEGN